MTLNNSTWELQTVTMSTAEIIEQAFANGMIQVREEIEALVDFLRPPNLAHALEIGSESGGTFYLWCRMIRGYKISIDLPSGTSGSGIYTDPKALAERKRKMLSWAPNVRLVTGDSHDLQTVCKVQSILKGDKLGLLFIDGDHSYEGVKRDYEMYREFVAPGGLIAFHDIIDSEYHRIRSCYVAQFWEELEGQKIEFNAKGDWGGIGCLKV